jgi:hypothetical protein
MRDSVPFTGPIHTVTGETIATGSTDFYDGTLAVGIRDEFGAHIWNRVIWNNTTVGGTRLDTSLCTDWTVDSSGPTTWYHNATILGFLGIGNCNSTASILCAEE